MNSDEVPDWLIDLNHEVADPQIFDNPDELGEISLGIDEFEATKDDYIFKVGQRLDVIGELTRITNANIRLEPFRLFGKEETHLNIFNRTKTAMQKLMDEHKDFPQWSVLNTFMLPS